MKTNRIIFMSALALIAFPTLSWSVDSDGCFQPMYGCVTVTEANMKGSTLHTEYRNNCGDRIYIKKCNERRGGSPDCGETGLAVGSTTSWNTSNATGRYWYKYTGSERSSADWVCAGKVQGWHDDYR